MRCRVTDRHTHTHTDPTTVKVKVHISTALPGWHTHKQNIIIQNITVRNQFRISERVNLERGVTSYFPGDRDKESTHSPFSPCTNRVGCVRCWGNFAETNRLALNGLKLWSPLTRVSSVVLEAEGLSPCTNR